jgi:hypothetical protein
LFQSEGDALIEAMENEKEEVESEDEKGKEPQQDEVKVNDNFF